MPNKHAMLSASSSARWLACPPSAQLCAALPDTVTYYALEGKLLSLCRTDKVHLHRSHHRLWRQVRLWVSVRFLPSAAAPTVAGCIR